MTVRGTKTYEGLGVSPGIAIGPAYLLDRGMLHVPEYAIRQSAVEAECKRFANAVASSIEQLKRLQAKARNLSGDTGEELGYLLDAHMHMLRGSRLIRGVEQRIRSDQINAEAAVQATLDQIADDYARVNDAYFASRLADIRDVGTRIIRRLNDTKDEDVGLIPKGSIVLAEEVTPADTARMDPHAVAGFAALLGGAEGHTGIMARSLGIPAVLGTPHLLDDVHPGDTIVVDGSKGRIIVRPKAKTIAKYRAQQTALKRERRTLGRLRDLSAVTRDKTQVRLQANVELPGEIDAAQRSGADGIGLLRTEYMFMNRTDLPGEDEQYQMLRQVVESTGGAEVTLRTLDVGGDKLASALGTSFEESSNPALGLRAIRLSLKMETVLETQLAAMLRAGAHGAARILLPLITTPSEVIAVRRIMHRVARRLVRNGVAISDPLPPLGVMIEVPAAALCADSLARVADFFSIGTNDLTMYTLAIDRGNEQVAHLYDPVNPAVLRLLQFSAAAAGRAGIPVSLCGEIAGDEQMTALLLGLGLRDLSMSPTSVPRVKRRIRALAIADAQEHAHAIMAEADPARIAKLIASLDRRIEAARVRTPR